MIFLRGRQFVGVRKLDQTPVHFNNVPKLQSEYNSFFSIYKEPDVSKHGLPYLA